MIKKLRRKLVITSMVSLLLVLTVIEGIVGILSYRKIVTDADRILNILEQNDGRFPRAAHPDDRDNMGRMSGKQERSMDLWRITVTLYAKMKKDRESGSFSLTEEGNCPTLIIWSKQDWGVTALGLGAVFVLMVLLSARITKPFVENYEKQKRFITDAGHELKTPLTIIDADTEVLEMDLGENEWIKDIQSQSKRLADLTNDLIALSRMEEDRRERVIHNRKEQRECHIR